MGFSTRYADHYISFAVEVKPEYGFKKIGEIRTGGVFSQNLFKKRADFFLVLLP